ncbi:unnamed protein product [Leuciscus chuanchicus]
MPLLESSQQKSSLPFSVDILQTREQFGKAKVFPLPLYPSPNWFKTCNYLLLGEAVNWIKVKCNYLRYRWLNGHSLAQKSVYLLKPPDCTILHGTLLLTVVALMQKKWSAECGGKNGSPVTYRSQM